VSFGAFKRALQVRRLSRWLLLFLDGSVARWLTTFLHLFSWCFSRNVSDCAMLPLPCRAPN